MAFDTAPQDRFCDLVMKGGIASGIVYPSFVGELAQHYRFKAIGGTSAGAIAACATAAAELRRRRGETSAYADLAKLADDLAQPSATGRDTVLFNLFQPSPKTTRLFRVLIGSLNAKSTSRRIALIVRSVLVAYWFPTVVSIGAGLALAYVAGWLAGLLGTLFLLVAFVGAAVYVDITRHVTENDLGLCTGMTSKGARQDALTPWLHALIQRLAQPKDDKPLTFGELWNAPGFPPSWLSVPGKHVKVRSIDLRMFTTNVSTGRPFVFPAERETCRLFFLTSELRRFFPESVVDHLVSVSKPYAPASAESDPRAERLPAALKDLLELPTGGDMPIIVAARMSLSFPVLFSAVPLWAIDYDTPRERRGWQRCYFADGGISSNFPIHLFDGPVPAWPTFGVSLDRPISKRPNALKPWLPDNYIKGYGERWNRFADVRSIKAKRFGGFLMAMIGTMQNWRDTALSRSPGVRDRVVRVFLKESEGGMNLRMPDTVIRHIATRGQAAAQEIIARFSKSGTAPAFSGWDEQRWIRFAVFVESLTKRTLSLHQALGSSPHGASLTDLIDRAAQTIPPGRHDALSPSEAAQLHTVVSALDTLSKTLLQTTVGWEIIDLKPDMDLRVSTAL